MLFCYEESYDIDSRSPFNKYLRLLTAVEQSRADDIIKYCTELNVKKDSLASASIRSIVWATEMNRLFA